MRGRGAGGQARRSPARRPISAGWARLAQVPSAVEKYGWAGHGFSAMAAAAAEALMAMPPPPRAAFSECTPNRPRCVRAAPPPAPRAGHHPQGAHPGRVLQRLQQRAGEAARTRGVVKPMACFFFLSAISFHPTNLAGSRLGDCRAQHCAAVQLVAGASSRVPGASASAGLAWQPMGAGCRRPCWQLWWLPAGHSAPACCGCGAADAAQTRDGGGTCRRPARLCCPRRGAHLALSPPSPARRCAPRPW